MSCKFSYDEIMRMPPPTVEEKKEIFEILSHLPDVEIEEALESEGV